MNLYRVYISVCTLSHGFLGVIKLINQQFYCFHHHSFHALGRELLVTARLKSSRKKGVEENKMKSFLKG